MSTKTIQLGCGRPMVLKMVSLQKLAATTDIDIPNQARQDLSDLVVYGAMISGNADPKKRMDENWGLVRSQLQLIKLLAVSPKVHLCTDGPFPLDGDYISDDDLFPADLHKAQEFFHKGGSDGVPAATNNGPGSGAPTDSEGAAVGEATE